MVTGELRSKVDRVWDAFWSGGISNPFEVIEQITYLLFIRRLDELQTLAENKANRTGRPVERVIFTGLTDRRRWKNFKDVGPAEMFETVADEVFPFLRTVGGEGSTYSQYMKDARFTVPSPALLSRVVDLLDDIPMVDRDTNGDLYEYMLGKIATAGQNGQLRTPRHTHRPDGRADGADREGRDLRPAVRARHRGVPPAERVRHRLQRVSPRWPESRDDHRPVGCAAARGRPLRRVTSYLLDTNAVSELHRRQPDGRTRR